MKLGASYATAIELPGCTITSKATSKKLIVYPYLFTDANAVLESGLGVSELTLSGVCKTSAERDALEPICESKGMKYLYFPSANGQDHDRYMKVYTHPAQLSPITATVYRYEIQCIAADSNVYKRSDDTAVW